MRQYKYSLIGIYLSCLTPFSYAEDISTTLQEIKVKGYEEKKTTGEIKKTRRAIQDELIADTKDLVRYTTDVGISDAGRHNKGFAMRGVEGNRVSISIDGVSLPDSEENSLYSRYGNFNSSRILIDPELVKGIDIIRGADSFSLGSGSLGGGVSYRSLEPSDILHTENQLGALLKTSYASKNREWTNTAGIAYNDKTLEAIGLYSYRKGHELKSLGNGAEKDGPARGKPDPSAHRNHNYLAKIAYLLNDLHRVSISLSGHRHNNYTDELSYTFSGWREAEDINERDNLNVAYEYFPIESPLSSLKVEYDYQKTILGTYNYKGGRNFNTNAKELDEVLDRQIHTQFHRISGRVDLSPLNLANTPHQLSLRTGLSRFNFENTNIDTNRYGVTYYSIQHPVRTTQLYLSLQDTINWTEKLQSNLGIRYDYAKVAPQNLKSPCFACFKKVPSAVVFESLSANLGLDYQFNETWKIAYHLASGYRIPSASEMFFTYEHPAGNWLANPKLNAERSLHQSLSLQAENDMGDLLIHLYRTNYKDFLYEKETKAWFLDPNCDAYCIAHGGKVVNETLFQQAINFDKAKIQGLEVTGKLYLDSVVNFIPQGWSSIGSIGYAKGKLSDGQVSLLSIQPMKAILGLGYDAPNDRWGIQSRWTYLAAKKAKDAQILTYYYDPRGKTQAFPYLNRSATLFDVYGFIKVGKMATLRAGAYNIFNRKYHTWDALRGINFRGTTNTVDRRLKGLERFYAPGRNFAVSLEIKF